MTAGGHYVSHLDKLVVDRQKAIDNDVDGEWKTRRGIAALGSSRYQGGTALKVHGEHPHRLAFPLDRNQPRFFGRLFVNGDEASGWNGEDVCLALFGGY